MNQPRRPATPERQTLPLSLIAACVLIAGFGDRARATPILPASDGTGTIVVPAGNQFDIFGGRLSSDGANLFHSFQQFGLDAGQIANFLAAPNIQNVLGRVVGGDPSAINGLLQLSGGNANLYLMNPAGIVFGPNARLNVSGDFFATTATAIGFGNDTWFEAFGSNDYQNLIGTPSQFAFDRIAPGAIVNAGDLGVEPGQHLALIAGQVANTGRLSAPGGQVTVSAVPGTSRVRLSQPGHLLSLEIEAPRDTNGQLLPVTSLDLPELLTASDVETGLVVQSGNAIQFRASGELLPIAAEAVLMAGAIDASNPAGVGGEIAVLGDRLALLDADLDAAGSTGGGNLRIGGEYQGQAGLPTARRTYISPNATLRADALETGDGGRVIVWADEVTGFYGDIRARGGAVGGDGGFAEVSGKEKLAFAGFVDAGAPFGLDGTVLLDPDVIIISNGSGAEDNHLLANTPPGQPAGEILAPDGGAAATFDLSVAALEGITGNINLIANNEIRIDSAINFSSLNIRFTAPRIDINAPVTVASPGRFNLVASDRLRINADVSAGALDFWAGNRIDVAAALNANAIDLTSGNALAIRAGGSVTGSDLNLVAAGDLSVGTGSSVAGTNVTLQSIGLLTIQDSVSGTDNLALRSDAIRISGPLTGNGNLTIEPLSANRPFGIGTPEISPRLDLEPAEMANIGTGFSTIAFGRADSTASVTIGDPTTLQDSMVIQGGSALIGPDFDTVWTLTGSSQGQFAVSGRTVNFNNIQDITSGSGDDSVRFQDGVDFGGQLDGGAGFDTLDYRLYSSPVSIDLENFQATGTTGVFNFEGFKPPTLSAPVPPPSADNPSPSVPIQPLPPLVLPNSPVNPPPAVTAEGDRAILTVNPRQAVERALDRGDIGAATQALDRLFSHAFSERLGRRPPQQSVDLLQRRLRALALETDTQPAAIYVFARREQLELILLPPVGRPIHYSVPEAPGEQVFARVRALQDEIVDPTRRRTTTYRAPAQQLDTWIMQTLEADLQQRNIDTLLFSLDEGLRSLPLAVLHDGEQFLVERYRFSTVPSLALTNLNFTDVRGASVLAMGIAKFQHLSPLPAVPLELAAIADQVTHSNTLLNEHFTLANLEKQRQQVGAAVVHLATHAEFIPEAQGQSFIQFWERPLAVEQLAKLDWNNPQLALLVLSACRTALGDPEAEYGFAGLAVQSGVDTAIASLWYASDIGTLGLMSEFYRYLDETPLKSEALRQAQIALLSGAVRLENDALVSPAGTLPLPPALAVLSDRQFQHPYYWSGFAAVGNPW